MIRTVSLAYVVILLAGQALAEDAPPATLDKESEKKSEELSEHLQPFTYIGKTYRGEFAGSTKEKPVIDVQRWERALNGQAVRILHSVNDGHYGGETLIMWDAEQKQIAFWYFTTAGFRTQGTMTHEDGKWTSLEKVSGEMSGITEVKAVSEILEDGRLRTTAMFHKNGEWVNGHEITYHEDPKAEVVFK